MDNFFKIERRKTKTARVGALKIGSEHPISVQSMTNCNLNDLEATIEQINRLEVAGCDLVRIAFPDIKSCKYIPLIKDSTLMPIVADVHFDYLIALEAIKQGADGIRLNPGNIKKKELINKVIEEAQEKDVMIRFGINAGSLNKKILEKYQEPNYLALVEEAEQLIEFLEGTNYQNFVISIKSSNVIDTIKANKIIAKKCDYPLHIGITEAGFEQFGIVKSSAGIGILLFDGIGDTIRISLTGDPVQEVCIGHDILRALGIKTTGLNLVTCPTCGRCEVNLYEIAKQVESDLSDIKTPLTVAIMGCIVNGPGEARNADAGIAFSKKEAMLFRKGIHIGRFNNIEEAINALRNEIIVLSK